MNPVIKPRLATFAILTSVFYKTASGSLSAGQRRTLPAVIGWITDVMRLGWGALYWNTRKTWHVARGRRHRCPCQVQSDSGRAHETGCEAMVSLLSPARLRVICPLLEQRGDGAWVCSVNAEQVRPFWGRALLLLGGGSLVAYIFATLFAFCLLRGIGYKVDYPQTLLPNRWSEFRAVQSQHYLELAAKARAAGQPAEALLALSNAYNLNPRDYVTGLLLAQLYQAGQPGLSDGVFARLYREHPGRREQTAQAWYRALLSRGDFAAVLPLARNRLLEPEGGRVSSAWTQAFIFAVRQTGDVEALERLAAAPELDESARRLFRLEQGLPGLSASVRVNTLTAALDAETDAFASVHILRRLLDENRLQLVWDRLAAPGGPIGDREKTRLQLDVLAKAGNNADRARLFRQLLTLPTQPALVELLVSHLVLHPDSDLLRALAGKLARDPLPSGETSYPLLLAWFAACGAVGDATLANEAAERLATVAARDSRAVAYARRALLEAGAGFRVETILPLLQPLPLEVIYALHERYSAPASA